MLFWVTTRGRDRIFTRPRDSAIVRTASRRTLAVSLVILIPLVGLVEPKLENNGIWTPVVEVGVEDPMMGYSGVIPKVAVGVVPTALAPPIPVVLLPHPKPSCVPRSRAKLRVAATTRASISTC